MCRNIRILFNFDPPATDEEMQAAALQFVRKVSGTRAPSKANREHFDRAVDAVFVATKSLLASLETHQPARDCELEAQRAKERSARRFARPT